MLNQDIARISFQSLFFSAWDAYEAKQYPTLWLCLQALTLTMGEVDAPAVSRFAATSSFKLLMTNIEIPSSNEVITHGLYNLTATWLADEVPFITGHNWDLMVRSDAHGYMVFGFYNALLEEYLPLGEVRKQSPGGSIKEIKRLLGKLADGVNPYTMVEKGV